jgi:hypothetical protein
LSWISHTRLSQQVNPVLMLFRSTSSGRHWVITLLAVLDAANLRICLNPGKPDPRVVQMLAQGALTLGALAAPAKVDPVEIADHNWRVEEQILRLMGDSVPDTAPECGVSRSQFEEGVSVLTGSGIEVPTDRDHVYRQFASLRAVYYPVAAGLAERLHAVPAPWSGPRNPPLAAEYPQIPHTPR